MDTCPATQPLTSGATPFAWKPPKCCRASRPASWPPSGKSGGSAKASSAPAPSAMTLSRPPLRCLPAWPRSIASWMWWACAPSPPAPSATRETSRRSWRAPRAGKRARVIDIGGCSAEIIGAEDGRLREAYSKPLGAVRLRENFLKDDPPTPLQLHQLHEYIRAKLYTAVERLGHTGWDRVIATSATAAAVASAVARITRSKRDDIDRLRVPTDRKSVVSG